MRTAMGTTPSGAVAATSKPSVRIHGRQEAKTAPAPMKKLCIA